MQDLYTENYKMLLREVQEDPDKWSDVQCTWVGRLNIIQSDLPKLTYRFNSIPIKIFA